MSVEMDIWQVADEEAKLDKGRGRGAGDREGDACRR
jgi:hypothetical protein